MPYFILRYKSSAICIALPDCSMKDIHTGNTPFGQEGARVQKNDVVLEEDGSCAVRYEVGDGSVPHHNDGGSCVVFVEFTADPEEAFLCLLFQIFFQDGGLAGCMTKTRKSSSSSTARGARTVRVLVSSARFRISISTMCIG